MNYKKLYDSIINSRITDPYAGYVEIHHILPKSLGGSDLTENLVKLSAREHFICHYLLTKMYTKNSVEYKKMVKAFFMMLNCKSSNQDRYNSSRLYEKLRYDFSLAQRENQLGEKNSQFGTVWIYNSSTKNSKRINAGDDLPFGWEYGRIINTKVDTLKDFVLENFEDLSVLQSLDLNSIKISNRLKTKITTQIKKLIYKNELKHFHDLYMKVGFDEMVKQTGYKFSLANLVQTFSRNLDDFIPQSRIKRGS